jgi:hypothetical protein
VSLSSSVFPSFVVITAWVTLLYVVGLAECRAATSIGRIGLESLALGRARCGAADICGFIQTSSTRGETVVPGTGGSLTSDHDATSGA